MKNFFQLFINFLFDYDFTKSLATFPGSDNLVIIIVNKI